MLPTFGEISAILANSQFPRLVPVFFLTAPTQKTQEDHLKDITCHVDGKYGGQVG